MIIVNYHGSCFYYQWILLLAMSFEDWRRIDVDQYDPENVYVEDELPDTRPNTSLQDIQSLTQTLRSSIQRMDIVNALKTAIENAPYGASEEVKDAFLHSVYEVFVSVKLSDINNFIGQFDIDSIDAIVKFVYVLMSKEWALKQSSTLIVWLDRIVETVGDGPIVRYLSDPYKL